MKSYLPLSMPDNRNPSDPPLTRKKHTPALDQRNLGYSYFVLALLSAALMFMLATYLDKFRRLVKG